MSIPRRRVNPERAQGRADWLRHLFPFRQRRPRGSPTGAGVGAAPGGWVEVTIVAPPGSVTTVRYEPSGNRVVVDPSGLTTEKLSSLSAAGPPGMAPEIAAASELAGTPDGPDADAGPATPASCTTGALHASGSPGSPGSPGSSGAVQAAGAAAAVSSGSVGGTDSS
jgi:collagen type III alpha